MKNIKPKPNEQKYSITDIVKSRIEMPMTLISGFMQNMKHVGAILKEKRPTPSKPMSLLLPQQNQKITLPTLKKLTLSRMTYLILQK